MSRSSSARALVALALTTTVGFGAVSTASASDATLKAKVVSLDKRLEKKSEAIEYPKDPKSPTFAKDYTAASGKLQTLLKSYRTAIVKEHASSDRGRKGRKLILSSVKQLSVSLKALEPLIIKSAATAAAGGEDSAEDLAAAKKIGKDLKAAIKDNVRSYKLLGLKAPKGNVAEGASA